MLLLLLGGQAVRAQSTTFSYTGSNQTYTVPAGVTQLQVTARGAGAFTGPSATPNGQGAIVNATIQVTPNEQLTVVVGGTPSGPTGGFNGGGNSPGSLGGGGATDLRRGTTRIVVAGGGGGIGASGMLSSSQLAFGGLGGNSGLNGDVGQTGASAGGYGGGGGSQTSGGALGYNGSGQHSYDGMPGSLGQGGNGGNGGTNYGAGGGGGGGYYGGGGGGGGTQSSGSSGGGGGGGAGSSYVAPAVVAPGTTPTYSAGNINNASLVLTPVVAAPTIGSFTPTSGPVGTSVSITGTNLTGATAVSFNGTAATSFTVNSATSITATVPTGASSGAIAVTTPGGTATSSTAFTVTVGVPTITNVSPNTGIAGVTSIVITGTNFSGTPLVQFYPGPNGVATNVVVNSPTQMTVTVPTGARSDYIYLTTPGGSTFSPSIFRVTHCPPPFTHTFSPYTQCNGRSSVLTVTPTDGELYTYSIQLISGPGVPATPIGYSSTPTAPNSYSWGVGSMQYPGSFSGHIVYRVTATANGCSSTQDVTLTIVDPVAPTTQRNVFRCGPGSVTLTASGAPAGATYRWYSGRDGSIVYLASGPSYTTPTLSANAVYSVSYEEGTGSRCESTRAVVDVNINPLPATPAATGSPSMVAPNQLITLSVPNPDAALTYTWTGPGLQSTTGATVTARPSSVGTAQYTVVASNSSGCASAASAPVSITVQNAPTVSGFTPGIGPVGTSVAITGTNFTGTTAVAFNGTAASFTVNSATSITATVPTGATSGTIRVTTPAGSGTSASSFTVTAPAPTVSGFSPSSGIAGTTSVVITGTNLSSVTSVRFYQAFATSFVSNSAGTELTVTVPTGARTDFIYVTTAGGGVFSPTQFRVSNCPVPFTFTVDPYVICANRTSLINVRSTDNEQYVFTLQMIGGVGFPGTTTSPMTNNWTFGAGGQVNGQAQYRITATANGCSSSQDFTLTIQNPPAPSAAPATRCGPGSVTLTAFGAPAGATYEWFDSPTATSPVASGPSFTTPVLPVGQKTYGVRYRENSTSNRCDSDFATVTVTVTPGPATPAATGSPSTAAPNQLITLSVTNPDAALTYTWTGPGLQTTTGATVTARVASQGTAQYTVTASNSSGCASAASAPVSILVQGAPNISSFTPTSGPVGTAVTISGSSFSGTSAVRFAGTDATFTVNSAGTQITTAVPAGAASGPISVTTPIGTVSSVGSFTVTAPAPTITNFTPARGPVNMRVDISGTNFTGVSSVTFTGNGGPVQANISTSSAGLISVNVPVGAISGPIRVTTPGGTAVSGSNFLVQPDPVVYSFSPASGPVGSQVIITGANFTGAQVVSFNSGFLFGTGFTVNSDNQITATVPASASTGPIGVNTGGSTGFSPTSFTVTAAAPTISSFTPTAGASGTSVTITGTGFSGATAVRFNGSSATYTVVSATQITTTVPAGATSGPISVTTAVGTATSSASFTVPTSAPTDLVVSTAQSISGSYNNVTITGTGLATLTGPLTVTGTLTVQNGGSLTTGCHSIGGSGSFVLAAGATLSICDAQGITASGSTGAVQLTGSRSFSPEASYVYNGSQAQVTGNGLPATVRNLTLSNAAGLTLSQPLALNQVLTLTNGVLTTGGQPLTLLSDANGTALVVNVAGTVGGNVTVQRYISPALNAGPGYRHLTAPVGNTTVADLATGPFSPVVNPVYNTSATPNAVTPFPTVFGYDQARQNSSPATGYSTFDKGWFSPASTTDALQPGRGYTVNLAAGLTPDFVGTLNNGTQTLSLARSTGAEAGWQLVGNPYPAPLDWSRVTPADRPGLNAAMYVYESTGAYVGRYRSYVNGIGNPVLPLGQGFFVRVADSMSTGTLTFRNAQRLTAPDATPLLRGTAADTRPQLQLSLRGAGTRDDAYVYAEAGATAGVEAEFDAPKLPNATGLNLAVLAGRAPLAIAGVAPFTATTVLPLQLQVPAPGAYTLQAEQLLHFAAGTAVYLRDAQTGQDQLLTPQTSYRFTLAGTSAGTRFSLLFRPSGVTATATALSSQLLLYPNPTQSSFTLSLAAASLGSRAEAVLYNALGQAVQRQVLPVVANRLQAEFHTAQLPIGVYTLRLTLADGTQLTKRVIKQ
jgi:hypothetical protein